MRIGRQQTSQSVVKVWRRPPEASTGRMFIWPQTGQGNSNSVIMMVRDFTTLAFTRPSGRFILPV